MKTGPSCSPGIESLLEKTDAIRELGHMLMRVLCVGGWWQWYIITKGT